jgi:cold shock protein
VAQDGILVAVDLPGTYAVPSHSRSRTPHRRSSTQQKGRTVPTGKVKWYDAEKGFGFLSREDGEDVYVRSSALPDGVTTLKAGTRVEFGILSGRKGDQAHQVHVLDALHSVSAAQRHAQRKKPEDMVGIVEDLIRLLEGAEEAYRNGRHPDAKTARPTAKLLRGLADELEI